ncbi:protein TIC 21, chloroplastic-like [Mangifera indica]|uniref:protein TIC 21, chloroplastic-like n=1 Tax=Mangifera indica TaxID=29780 RepID=UPI001CFBDAB1|nr:protein TIC 21, chloroplastic-like [Mangifera indica]
MQVLLLPPTGRSCILPPVVGLFPSHRRISSNVGVCPPNCFSSAKTLQSSSNCGGSRYSVTKLASSPVTPAFTSRIEDSEKAKLAQVAKRLENTSRSFKRLGSLGFWGQLVCTVVAAVILSFSIVVTGKITSPATFYATAGGIAAAFISVFWSFGYIQLSEKLQKTASDPSKAPPRADVVKSLKNGIILNLLGMGAAILGMQATVGQLVAKALTSSANPYYQGVPPGYSPVLALDVFLVQASANTILSHFLGLVFSLELLRSVTLPASPVPRVA